MGRPTAIRAVDSWVVGAAGGSMARIGRRRIREVGPRSAHVAGLDYACFAEPAELEGAELRLIAPHPGDPAEYAVVEAGGRRFALTATCAANALGLVGEDSYAFGSREAATIAFAELARRLRRSPEEAAKALLDGAVRKIADAVREAAHRHRLDRGFPLIALGGSADALVPEVAAAVGADVVRPPHAEVLSSVGAAISLIRAEVARSPRADGSAENGAARLEIVRDVERACVESGAAPHTVSVETSYDQRSGVVRAVATGAVSLETGAATRTPLDDHDRLDVAARVLGIGRERLELLLASDFYCVFSENGSGRVAAIDRLGGVALAQDARSIMIGEGSGFVERLRGEVADCSVNLGITAMLPRVSLVCGPRVLDLSDARRPEEIVSAAERLLAEQAGSAVAVLAR